MRFVACLSVSMITILIMLSTIFESSAFLTVANRKYSRSHHALSSEAATLDQSPTIVDVSNSPHVLTFIEPTTQILVKLVGAMHYNPHSIDVARTTCEDLASVSLLGSVVVESCSVRWKRTAEFQPSGSILRSILDNEMQAAADVAAKYGVPVILGDQDIADTKKRMGQAFKESLRDILSPFSSGWQRLYYDIKEAYAVAVPSGEKYLTAGDFFHPKLLLAAPVSFIRYPLAIIAKSPKIAIPLLIAITALNSGLLNPNTFGLDVLSAGGGGHQSDAWASVFQQILGSVFGATAAGSESAGGSGLVGLEQFNLFDTVADFAGSSLAVAVESALLGRMFLVALLAERNKILAANILSECQRLARDREADAAAASASGGTSSSAADDDYTSPVVVAVLGMAHCNGIQKIMLNK